jgi:N-methylhydantoinase A
VHCRRLLGRDAARAANGTVEIANTSMMGAIRLLSVQRGDDPHDFVLAAFDRAGPLHTKALARGLDTLTILIPPNPGIASALPRGKRHFQVDAKRHRVVWFGETARFTSCPIVDRYMRAGMM